MTERYEAILRARGEQIVGRIDPRRDALAHSYVREVAESRRIVLASQPEPRRWMRVIAALAFMVGLAIPVAIAVCAVLAVWLNR